MKPRIAEEETITAVMFGFGPGYAELLRPDEAREIREEKEARAKANGDEERAGSADGGSDDEEEDDEEEAEEAFIRHVRFANSHRQLQRSCTIDTEADALAHGIDRQLFLEWTRCVKKYSDTGVIKAIQGVPSARGLGLG